MGQKTRSETKEAARHLQPAEAAGAAGAGNPDAIPLEPLLDNHGKLKSTARILNGIAARGEQADLPANLPFAAARADVVAHIAALKERQDVGSAQSDAVQKRDDVVRRARKIVSRYGELIDAYYPAGSAGRASFFPVGVAEPSLAVSLATIAAALEEHPFKRYPREYPLSLLKKTVEELPRVTAERETAGEAMGSGVVTRADRGTRTRAIHKQLVKMLHGWYGVSGVELSAYGLKPRPERAGGRRPKKAKETPPSGAPTK